ncbi:methylglyoxal reductase (NADPH-dependent) GRE2 [Sugiyamaella lignohabitans]|uniref:Methylglyoxal reductase (NADPH-dependent) GRE2 n=1 Tax=Sugiyamaella lignohabitans TaxID=796027 RepID=A0A167F754_9ASCO|nr:methylglyoxal reductase (NADPH-dependent) GRE2 [Sugiyamaella lignohabitans]ANB14895.1 methylglyoxal reductase (NADPH-dependent) GRE2 [Sugiyamaella lignohabitans]
MSARTVLVTGASGYIAAHVILNFLEAGYRVIGTVRSQQSLETVKKSKFYSRFPGKYNFKIVPDITSPGAFDDAVANVDGVIHTQSPYITSNITDNESQLLIPAIRGTVGILESIKKVNPKVKRVVITSSFAAIGDIPKGADYDHTYSEKDWNPATYEQALASTEGGFVYCASKALAEKAAWDFVEREKPNFSLSVINPPPVYGPIIHNVTSLANLGTSAATFYKLMNGSLTSVPATRLPTVVDVRDVGKAHLLAYEKDVAAGQRYLTTSGRFFFEQICQILLTEFPDLSGRVPVPTSIPDPAPEHCFRVDNSKSKQELGIEYYTLKQTVVDTAKSLLQLENSLQ